MHCLTIFIPTYNRVKSLQKCIDSILANDPTCLRVRIVVSDNHSTDGTSEYLKSLGDKVTINTQPRNIEALGNLKWCLRAAMNTNSYVWILGDDDEIVPTAFKQLSNAPFLSSWNVVNDEDDYLGLNDFITGYNKYKVFHLLAQPPHSDLCLAMGCYKLNIFRPCFTEQAVEKCGTHLWPMFDIWLGMCDGSTTTINPYLRLLQRPHTTELCDPNFSMEKNIEVLLRILPLDWHTGFWTREEITMCFNDRMRRQLFRHPVQTLIRFRKYLIRPQYWKKIINRVFSL